MNTPLILKRKRTISESDTSEFRQTYLADCVIVTVDPNAAGLHLLAELQGFANISGQDSYHTHGEQVSLIVTKLLFNYLLALTTGLRIFVWFLCEKSS